MPICVLINDNASVLSHDALNRIKQHADGTAELVKVSPEADVKDLLSTQLLFGAPRVFWVSSPSSALLKQVTEALDAVDDSDLLLITVQKMTPSQRKPFEQAGSEIQASTKRNINEDGKRLLAEYALPDNVKTKILQTVGTDIDRIPGIAETLSSLNPSDLRFDNVVQAYIGAPGEAPVWSILDAVDAADAPLALRSLHRVSLPPVAVRGALMAHFQRLYAIQEAQLKTPQEAASYLGVKGSTYPLQKAIRILPRYGTVVEQLLKILTQAGADLRGGNPLPDMLLLEILVGRLCTYPRR